MSEATSTVDDDDTTDIDAPISTETLNDYKKSVRRIALVVQRDQGWSTGGLNETLTILGLPPKNEYEAKVVVTAKQTVSFTVTGRTEAEAIRKAKAKEPTGYTSSYNWTEYEAGDVELTVVGTTDVEPDPDASSEEMDVYKKLVRRTAIRAAAKNGWCDSGLNRYLERLGLAPKVDYRVPVSVVAERSSIMVTINDAESREEAIARVMAGDATIADQVTNALGNGWRAVSHGPADLESVKVRDADPTDYYNNTAHCRQRNAEGYRCTRDRGHEGQHIAGDSVRVVSVWPQEAAATTA